ncbi:hypothetical protein GQ457_18G006220 [Hibiscus cannabinus]
MTIHVYLKPIFPPQHLRGAADFHLSVKRHFSSRHIREELAGVVSQLHPVQLCRQLQDPAGPWGLRPGFHVSGTEEGSVVEDGHGGGRVVDGGDVGVGDEVSLMEMRWKVGSLGLALMRAVAAIAEAAPTKAEVQLQLTFLGIGFCPYLFLTLEKLRAKKGEIEEKNGRWI